MINSAINFLYQEVNQYVKRSLDTQLDVIVMSNIVSDDTDTTVDLNNKIIFSLIYIEEERVHKSQETYSVRSTGTVDRFEPELKFNLYVLFASKSDNINYANGLNALSEVISFFQGKNVFDSKNYPALPPTIGRLVVDVYSQAIEKNYEFWQSLGGKFLPSIMYKIRLVTYQRNQNETVQPPIQAQRLTLKDY